LGNVYELDIRYLTALWNSYTAQFIRELILGQPLSSYVTFHGHTSGGHYNVVGEVNEGLLQCEQHL